LERKIAPLYRTLLARLASGTTEIQLTPMEYGQFCYSVAMQYTRVPNFRDKIALFMKLHAEGMFDQIVEAQRKTGTLPPQVDEMLRRKRPQVVIEDWGTIKTMLEAAVSVSNALMDKTPGFFRPSPGNYFVTADNPVTYYIKDHEKYDIRQLEPVHPDAEVLFPLSRNAAVVFFPYKSGYGSTRYAIRCQCLDLLSGLMEHLNVQTAIMATRYVYTPMRMDSLGDAIGHLWGSGSTVPGNKNS